MFPLFLLAYLLLINLLAFALMGWDKRQAKRKARRKSERSLLTVAAIGGSLGIYLGSQYWRHKTYKKEFKQPFRGIVGVQALLFVGLAYFFWNN